jgi:hypothetical protein
VAAPRVLKSLDLRGKVVTADALLAQRDLSIQIVEAGGEYVWTIKDNQPDTRQAIETLFQPEECVPGFRLCRKITLPICSMLMSRRLTASVQPKTRLAGRAHESQKETINSQMHLCNLSSSSQECRRQRTPCDQPGLGRVA